MTEALLFRHAQGHTPDLFGGRAFRSIAEGLAYIGGIAILPISTPPTQLVAPVGLR